MGLNNHSALFVWRTNHGAFCHSFMCQKCGFNLRPRYIVTRRNNHIVISGGKVKVTIFVLVKSVSGDVPTVLDIFVLSFCA